MTSFADHVVAAEILIKINKHIFSRIYDFPYILPQIKPTLKGPKTMAFSKYFSDYNTSSWCIYQNVLIELHSIRMPQISKIIEHEKYFVLHVLLCIVSPDENTKNATTVSNFR